VIDVRSVYSSWCWGGERVASRSNEPMLKFVVQEARCLLIIFFGLCCSAPTLCLSVDARWECEDAGARGDRRLGATIVSMFFLFVLRPMTVSGRGFPAPRGHSPSCRAATSFGSDRWEGLDRVMEELALSSVSMTLDGVGRAKPPTSATASCRQRR